MKTIQNFIRDDSGVTAIEYGLIASLVGLAIIAGASFLGDTLNTVFDTIADTIGTETGAGGGGGGDGAGGGPVS